VRVAFTIDRDGLVRGSRIVQRSELDHEALAMLTRAQPVAAAARSHFEPRFVLPVRFNIRYSRASTTLGRWTERKVADISPQAVATALVLYWWRL
jgi:TonB family protein